MHLKCHSQLSAIGARYSAGPSAVHKAPIPRLAGTRLSSRPHSRVVHVQSLLVPPLSPVITTIFPAYKPLISSSPSAPCYLLPPAKHGFQTADSRISGPPTPTAPPVVDGCAYEPQVGLGEIWARELRIGRCLLG